jgi:hypothetical protein
MSSLPRVTIDQVMSWQPCISRDEVAVYFRGRVDLDAREILALHAPVEYRLWAVLRPEMIPESMLWALACDYAEHVLHIYEAAYPGDERPRDAIAMRRAWLRGEADDVALAAAWAAGDAAWAAGGAAWAAWAAARAAARAAADAAVSAADVAAAARAAAWAAAGAARDAAWAAGGAESLWQIEHTLAELDKIGG